MERDEYGRAKRGRPQDFNSHAHVERDTRLVACAACQRNFNSHAHVERDNPLRGLFFILRISTHTLTWSVTDWLKYENVIKDISTHTLTWSVTEGGLIVRDMVTNFNSHAHVERDLEATDVDNYVRISTHTLTWSVTFPV